MGTHVSGDTLHTMGNKQEMFIASECSVISECCTLGPLFMGLPVWIWRVSAVSGDSQQAEPPNPENSSDSQAFRLLIILKYAASLGAPEDLVMRVTIT